MDELFGPRKRLACPECGGEQIATRHSMKKVTRGGAEWEAGAAEREAEKERLKAQGCFIESARTPGWRDDWSECWVPDEPQGTVCNDCDCEAETSAPFEEAGERLTRKEQRQERNRREQARKKAEAEMGPLVDQLVGRTITAVKFHVEDPADVEGATLTLDDGKKLTLSAYGWHDIQSLGVEIT